MAFLRGARSLSILMIGACSSYTVEVAVNAQPPYEVTVDGAALEYDAAGSGYSWIERFADPEDAADRTAVLTAILDGDQIDSVDVHLGQCVDRCSRSGCTFDDIVTESFTIGFTIGVGLYPAEESCVTCTTADGSSHRSCP